MGKGYRVFLSFCVVFLALGAAGRSLIAQSAPSFPSPAAPEKDWDAYWKWFGKTELQNAVASIPGAGQWTNWEKAKYIAGKVGDRLAQQGYKPNATKEDRKKAKNDPFYQQGSCNECIRHVGSAYDGAGVAYHSVVATRNFNPYDENRNHAWILVEDEPGKNNNRFHAVDLWLHGRETKSFANLSATPLATGTAQDHWNQLRKEQYKFFQVESMADKKVSADYASIYTFADDVYADRMRAEEDKEKKRIIAELTKKHGGDAGKAYDEYHKMKQAEADARKKEKTGKIQDKDLKKDQDKIKEDEKKEEKKVEEEARDEGTEEKEEEINIFEEGPSDDKAENIDKRIVRSGDDDEEINVFDESPGEEGDDEAGAPEEETGEAAGDAQTTEEAGNASAGLSQDSSAASAGQDTSGLSEFDGAYRGNVSPQGKVALSISGSSVEIDYDGIRFSATVDASGHVSGIWEGPIAVYENPNDPENPEITVTAKITFTGEISGDLATGGIVILSSAPGMETSSETATWSAQRD
jgi:hypothetical protein